MDWADLTTPAGGDVLAPGDEGFEAARSLWNTRFDRNPDRIVLCTDARDVEAAVEFAGANRLTLSVKGGGHSYAANTVRAGGLLIDLSGLKSIHVDADARTVTVGGGVTGAEMDAATQEHGLAVPTPTASTVGVAGAALGGGAGWLSRKYGLTLDNVLSIDVVTAQGRSVTATSDDNSDLFWALRGGGGNFGVVTSMTLRLHEVGPEVLSGQIIYPFDDAGDHLRFFRDFMQAAPRDFQCYPFMFRVPPIDLFPAEYHGKPVLDFVVYHEDPTAADFVEPLRDLGDTVLDFVAPTPYVQVQQAFDANLPKGQRYYSKAHDLASFSDGVIDTVVEFVPEIAGPLSAAYFDPVGGAIGEVAVEDTAYAGRETRYGFHVIAGWMDPAGDEAVMGWTSALHEAMAVHSTGGVYVNLIGDDESSRIPSSYGPNYERLRTLKKLWDPTNLFSGNYNIDPAR